MTVPERSRGHGAVWARRVAALCCLVVALGATAALAACVLVPRVAGATPYAVLTGSMRPDLPPGTLVVVRPVGAASLRVGDVVTYQLRSGEPEVVTHRVVARGQALDGRVVLQVQGDANDGPDPTWVREEQVRGELWYAVPMLGRLHTWLDVGQREVLVRVVAAGFGLHALAMVVAGVRGRRSVEVSRAHA